VRVAAEASVPISLIVASSGSPGKASNSTFTTFTCGAREIRFSGMLTTNSMRESSTMRTMGCRSRTSSKFST
jgi:hypothetical protein